MARRVRKVESREIVKFLRSIGWSPNPPAGYPTPAKKKASDSSEVKK